MPVPIDARLSIIQNKPVIQSDLKWPREAIVYTQTGKYDARSGSILLHSHLLLNREVDIVINVSTVRNRTPKPEVSHFLSAQVEEGQDKKYTYGKVTHLDFYCCGSAP